MQDIRVAAVSMNGRLGEPGRVLDEISDWVNQGVAAGAELMLFPELVIHGHCTPNTYALAERVPDGPSTQRLCKLAAQYQVLLSAGLSEKENDLVFNTQVLVGPDGYIGKQRKLHLSRDEVLFYKGGRKLSVFDLGKCRVGISICYDNMFPEVARILALRGAEVLLMPHAVREKPWGQTSGSQQAARQWVAKHYRNMMPTRCRENSCFAVAADQAGRAGYVDRYPENSPSQPHHAGGAYIVDPGGQILAQTQEESIQSELVVATLKAATIANERAAPNFTLKTRRPELFGDLVVDQIKS